ncbi:MAG: heme exporter protein CcmD [Pseudomonadota bacterium]
MVDWISAPLIAAFGERYVWFIVSSYGVSAIVLAGLVVWVLVVHRSRRRAIQKLEAAGIRRAASAQKNRQMPSQHQAHIATEDA